MRERKAGEAVNFGGVLGGLQQMKTLEGGGWGDVGGGVHANRLGKREQWIVS